MGTGTDIAIESGVTLVRAISATSAPAACHGRRARNIRQNLRLVYNTVGVPIAAGVLHPFAGLLITPVGASAAMTRARSGDR